MKHMIRVSLIAVSMFFAACGAKPPPPVQVEAPAPEPEPECLPGCRLERDKCQMEGNVVEGGRVEKEIIDCHPACCDPNSDAQSKIDADSDGIINDRDECINVPEDFDGFQDDDGCPEEDNDGDKILDDDDVCPLDAEDYDGFQDDDGCPD